MGLLAPLYLAGLAALALPLVSPPTLTRRSRLDQILLLLMRLAALALLAFAFSRPFVRQSKALAFEDLPERRVAILVDVSASMRRGDLWQQALAQAEKELAELGPNDEVALYAFSDKLQRLVPFASGESTTPEAHRSLIRQQLSSLRPGWGATDIGAALVAAAGELDAASDVKQLAAEPQVVLISDFQAGARLESLQAFEWPKRVQLIARALAPKLRTNAFAHLVTGEEEAPEADLRVRVVNAADSPDEQFFVSWASETANGKGPGNSPANQVAVFVPPGQSRIVKLPRQEGDLASDRIVLRGDDHDFDNTFYVVPPRKQEIKLLYLGADAADDEQGPQHYLRLATSGDPLRQIEIHALAADDAAPLMAEPKPKLVVLTRGLSAAMETALRGYLEGGGMLVAAPVDRAAATTVCNLVGGLELREEPVKRPEYLLLGEIDFTHPLFAPLAGPRYSDFTKIHFWKSRPLATKPEAKEVRVVARFDNREPAVMDCTLGKGRALVWASSWHPEDTQLALSTKFVPLVGAMLDEACGLGTTLASLTVGQPATLPARGDPISIQRPSGREVLLAPASASFADTDEPGIYRAGAGSDELRFAVNLAAAESNTAPLPLEQLEQLGVKMGTKLARTQELDQLRQERDTELESRQKIWRWLIAAGLVVLVVETWWAGRAARQAHPTMEIAR
jgi:Mg-chelatase subunit ChlD